MAIHPSNPTPAQSTPSAAQIEAWTEQAAVALAGITISAPPIPTPVALEIPLDAHERQQRIAPAPIANDILDGYVKRKEPLRRDSLKRREALKMGREGSRRRQRWENDRLLHNPYAQPPLSSDWEVRPTCPVRHVPYYLAPLWDAKLAADRAAERADLKKAGSYKTTGATAEDATDKVSKEVREKLKRARGAKGLLMDLEQEVRNFVERWDEQEAQKEKEGLFDPDSEDEEIVFVGRNGQMSDMPPSPKRDEREPLPKDKLVFDSLADDKGASFGRWLVHSIGAYYGLRTWSVTKGNPARREAYVGIKVKKTHTVKRGSAIQLPRPLYGMV
ncbi:hypothetical protein M501DRAFT_999248 [Patellaria atrata CBS 101060]|uniref:R3H-associated N-terminal domain-containing protein n=1 Tax=Patellaria atrata CBS 101060 TaxID=1346257 RepID=A0A9P4S4Y5_9PEZI|nr:hypothetical protein M501DRAFT_999248 [Patellaria atrata CBS 101060]